MYVYTKKCNNFEIRPKRIGMNCMCSYGCDKNIMWRDDGFHSANRFQSTSRLKEMPRRVHLWVVLSTCIATLFDMWWKVLRKLAKVNGFKGVGENEILLRESERRGFVYWDSTWNRTIAYHWSKFLWFFFLIFLREMTWSTRQIIGE